jgi:hypothetical protein
MSKLLIQFPKLEKLTLGTSPQNFRDLSYFLQKIQLNQFPNIKYLDLSELDVQDIYCLRQIHHLILTRNIRIIVNLKEELTQKYFRDLNHSHMTSFSIHDPTQYSENDLQTVIELISLNSRIKELDFQVRILEI